MVNIIKKEPRSLHFKDNIYTVLVLRLLLVMGLFSLCRIGFYLFNKSYFPEVSFHRLMYMMYGGLGFDLTAVLYTNLLVIILHILPFRFIYNNTYQRVLRYLFYIVNTIAMAANCIDFIYFKFTLRRTTASVFGEFSHEKNMPLLFLKFIGDYWYVFLFWIFLIILMVKIYRKIRLKRESTSHPLIFYPVSVVMMAIILALFVAGVRGGFKHSTRPITLNNAGIYVKEPVEMNIVLNTPFAIFRTLNKKTLEKVSYFKSLNELNQVYNPIYIPKSNNKFIYDNVVVIIVESLSREFVGAFNKELEDGKYQGYTPFIDSLMNGSKVYWYAFANGKKSIDAMPSILASIPSIKEPFVLSHYSSDRINSLASLLREKGYQTSFFHGAPNGSMGFEAFANLAGYEHYYGKTEYGNNADYDGTWGIWDEEFLQFMAKTLDKTKPPFFSTVFTVSSHHPFALPERYKNKFRKGPLPVDQCINYTDYSLKKFFETASKMKWYKNTLFVISADHTTTATFPEYKTSVGFFAIPILFYMPGGSLKGTEYKIAQQIDIMPTILNYLHYDEPFLAFGNDLFDKNKEGFAINYLNDTYQLFVGDYLLRSDDKAKPLALFDFKKDIFLKDNLLDKMPQIQHPMEQKLRGIIQHYNNRMIGDSLTVGKNPLKKRLL